MYHDELTQAREAHRICSELRRSVDLRDALRQVLVHVRAVTGCGATGLRLEKDGDYPYFVQDGFSNSFVLHEYSLCPGEAIAGSGHPTASPGMPIQSCPADGPDRTVPANPPTHVVPRLECLCGRILSGLSVGGPENTTTRGTFFTNDALSLAETADPEGFGLNPRYMCMRSGYASIALLPVRGPDGMLGLLQVNDQRKDFFDAAMLSFLELIADDIGLAVFRSLAQERIRTLERDCAGMSERIRLTERFLGQLGNRLRSPVDHLNTLLGQLAVTPLSQQQAALLASCREAGTGIGTLCGNLLESMHAAQCEEADARGPFRIGELLRWMESSFRHQASDKGIQLLLEPSSARSETVVGDLAQIRRILCVLTDNAIRYARQGSVRLGAVVTLRHGAMVRIRFSVSDTGPGLPAALAADPFRPFAVLETPACQAAGAGLGLSIAKMLATRLGAVLRHEPRPGGGTLFSLELLLQSPDTVGGPDDAREAEMLASMEPVAGRRVLLVEDDPVNARVMAGYLSQGGMIVHQAPNARECMDLLSRYRMDAILMDVGLPEMDGLGLARMIRRTEADGEHVPIIAVTGIIGPFERQRCLDAGMDGYLPKPVRIVELVSLLKEILTA